MARETNEPPRCKWPGSDPLYVAYHDREWGVPVRDDRALFEMLMLEGAQAGLSWITILRKRDNYRRAFDNFDPDKIARYTPAKVAKLLADDGIVRNRLKIEGVVGSAKAYLAMRKEGLTLSTFLWEFVGGEPIVNRLKPGGPIPAETEISRNISKALKQRGFKFVGPTIIYAFMQAVGLVNDHLVTCYRHPDYRKRAKR
ncbi:MAG: DNA-3-methyladenine glycosylase I [Hyphomonadaceae bacterium]